MLAGSNQSDKVDYPVATFSMGFTSLGKMKGIEKHAVLFPLCIFLHSEVSKTKKFSGISIEEDNQLQKLRDWRKVFEKSLYYHDCLMQPSFKRSSLQSFASSIIEFHKLLKKLIFRDGKGINTIPKFHEMFHIVRDIEQHGPAIMFDSCITEGHHHSQKQYGGRTQKQLKVFTQQTGKRLYEDQVVSIACQYLEQSEPQFSYKKRVVVEENGTSSIQYGGEFLACLDSGTGGVILSVVPGRKDSDYPNLSDYTDFSHSLRSFLKERLFLLFQAPFDNKVKCYSSIRKKDILFKGYSRIKSEYPGWAEFQWCNPGTDDTFVVPGKILMFLDFSNIEFKSAAEDIYYKREIHVIIQSLRFPIEERSNAVHYPVCVSVKTEDTSYEYWIVSIKTIFDTCYVIPNFSGCDGEFDSKSYLYVFPRNYRKRKENVIESNEDNRISKGWYNKF